MTSTEPALRQPSVDIDMAAFARDPYPTLARLRREAPVAFVAQLGGWVLSRRDDIYLWEKDISTFSSEQPGGLMTRLMGHNMMRKDGADHMAERKVFLRSVSPQAAKEVWTAAFQARADRILDELVPIGAADLAPDFALRLAGECLKDVTGLSNVSYSDMDAWSRALIEGIANYSADGGVEARCQAAVAAINAAVADILPVVVKSPGHCLLSVLSQGGLDREQIAANIRLTISGGQNEPRKAIIGTIWALLTHPDQLAAVRAGEASWRNAFEEFVRWISPIGMTPRRIAQSVTIHGAHLKAGDRAFLFFSSANRDERHFTDAHLFDVRRDTAKAIPFGAGPHFCAGAFASRAMIADVALPSIFKRLPELTLDTTAEPVRIAGWAFRGLANLPARWTTG